MEAVQEEGHELLGILLGQRLELVELVVHQMLHGRWRGGRGGEGREEGGEGRWGRGEGEEQREGEGRGRGSRRGREQDGERERGREGERKRRERGESDTTVIVYIVHIVRIYIRTYSPP